MPRPDDECPYPKPFAADFDACPAFQARQFIPLDTLYQPLDPVLTCRHLETRSLPQRHRWYAACGLGDAEQRRRWAREVGVSRLQRIRAVQRQLSVAIAPYNARLWELKGQQLRAIHDGRDASQATAELRRLAGQMTADLDAFLKEKSATFSDIDMPIEAARVLKCFNHINPVPGAAGLPTSSGPHSPLEAALAWLDWRAVCGLGGIAAAVIQVWLYRRLTQPPVSLELLARS